MELYGNFGDQGITMDGWLLASITEPDELKSDNDDVWERFKAAGGDQGHSGVSWYCVRQSALNILTGFTPYTAEPLTDEQKATYARKLAFLRTDEGRAAWLARRVEVGKEIAAETEALFAK